MELKLVGPSSREYHGHLVGSAEHGLALELVVRSIEDNAAAPSFIEVRGGRGVKVEASATPHALVGPSDAEASAEDGSGFVRSRLMRRGDTLFYPFVAKAESPDWAVYRRLDFEVRVSGTTTRYGCALIGRRAIRLAVAALLFSVLLFAVRLVPIAMRLAPTNANLVLALLLQGTPAAVVVGILVGAFKDALPRWRDGDLSVLGMERPLTMLLLAALATGASLVLPLFCWEIGNATQTNIKANWSSYESVEFPSSSWVSSALTGKPDLKAVTRLLPEYGKRYCVVACPAGTQLPADGCIPATEDACKTKRSGTWYEVYCRTPVWAYPGLVPFRNTAPITESKTSSQATRESRGIKLETDPTTCAPKQPAEAEANVEGTTLRLIWSESSPPSEALVKEYLGQPLATNSPSVALLPARHALKIRVDALESRRFKIVLSAAPADPEISLWLSQTSSSVTSVAHDYFVPVSPNTDKITLSIRDTTSSGNWNGTLSCSRTAMQSFGVRVLELNEMSARVYEQTSGGVDSRWHSPDDAPFVAMCYDASAGQPSSASLQVTRLGAQPGESKKGTAALKFPPGQAPGHLTVFVRDAQQGEVTCKRDESLPNQPPVWFENSHGEPKKVLNSSPALTSFWTAVDASKNVAPWFCSSHANEELREPPGTALMPGRVAEGNACCFSAGHLSLMSCQEAGWTCRPKRFEPSFGDWLKGKGCNPAAVKECVRVVQ